MALSSGTSRERSSPSLTDYPQDRQTVTTLTPRKDREEKTEVILISLRLRSLVQIQSPRPYSFCNAFRILDFWALCRYNKGMFEDLMRRYGFVALLLSLVFLVVFSENGLVDYVKLKGQIKAIDASITQLQKENVTLKGEIERLARDDKYLEEVARKRYGFIREGEKVYRIER